MLTNIDKNLENKIIDTMRRRGFLNNAQTTGAKQIVYHFVKDKFTIGQPSIICNVKVESSVVEFELAYLTKNLCRFSSDYSSRLFDDAFFDRQYSEFMKYCNAIYECDNI